MGRLQIAVHMEFYRGYGYRTRSSQKKEVIQILLVRRGLILLRWEFPQFNLAKEHQIADNSGF